MTETVHNSQHPTAARQNLLVLRPGQDGWDDARQAWNLTADQRPAAVAMPRTAEEVVEVVSWARSQGMRVAAQGTGHAAAAHRSLDGAVLVKTSRLREVHIDPELRRARVGAGTTWSAVSNAAAEFGLATLAGSGPDVGVVGYTLGGGLSWLARRYGLAANGVLAVELVTAEGRQVRADAYHEPDLFWALRGGGGAFGVVTAIEFELFPVADVYAGTLFWPIERADTVLDAWREWSEAAPRDVTSLARLLNLPPLPEIPEPIRGRSFVAVEFAFLGDAADGAALLHQLRRLGPEIDTAGTIPAARLAALHMDPDHPVPGVGDGWLLDGFSAETAAALIASVGAGTGSPLMSVEIRQLGGAISQAPRDAGAVGSIDAPYAMYAVGMAISPDIENALHLRIDSLRDALAPWVSPRGYLNFRDQPGNSSDLFPAATFDRLRQIKTAYDPGDLFLSNHSIPPAGQSAPSRTHQSPEAL